MAKPQASTLETGDAIAAEGAEAPRVSLADMQERVAFEASFTAYNAMVAMGLPAPDELRGLTLSLVVLDNGWTLLGKSAPASLENFDAEKGRIFARDDALRQLWPLMGFVLREKLAADDKRKED